MTENERISRRIAEIVCEGHRAYLAGNPTSACPYSLMGNRIAWMRGWAQAEAKAKTA